MNLKEALSESLEQDVTILAVYDLLEHKFVRFDTNDRTGHAILTKGIGDHYRIGDVYQEDIKGPVYFAQFKTDKNHLIIETLKNFESLVIKTTQEPIVYESSQGIFDIIETPLGKAALKSYHLESETAFDLYLDYTSKYTIDAKGYTGHGPDYIVNVACIGIIFIGYCFTLLLTKKNNWIEGLYFKMTKTHNEVQDNDPNDYTLMT